MGRDSDGGGFANQNNENTSSNQILDFLLKNYNGEKYLVAVADAGSAEQIIIQTGKPVMAVGGFSGNDNILTAARFEKMVQNGEIRYFQAGGRGMGQNSEITNWVTEHGKAVTFNENNSNTTAGNGNHGFGQFGGRMGGGILYDLAPEKG